MAAKGTPATAVLDKQRVAHTLHPYAVATDTADYGRVVAEALGVAPERVFKTLVTEVDGELTVVDASVTGFDTVYVSPAGAGCRPSWRPPT